MLIKGGIYKVEFNNDSDVKQFCIVISIIPNTKSMAWIAHISQHNKQGCEDYEIPLVDLDLQTKGYISVYMIDTIDFNKVKSEYIETIPPHILQEVHDKFRLTLGV